MTSKQILIGALLAVVCVTKVLADDRPGTQPEQETAGGALATMRTIAYFPFKGVVCVVGTLASFPVYWLSGLDPQVKQDTETIRARYCSRDYLFSSEWPK
jgi:hypothetical protein